MSHSSSWPIPVTGYDSLRLMTKRVDRQARNASPISAADLLGPGMSSQAIHILDWNDEITTFNGNFYTTAGGLNSPVVEDDEGEEIVGLPWIGSSIAREDGTGTTQVWNTDDPGSMYFRVRNWAPNPDDPDAPPIFGDWQRFATRSGFIAEEDLHPDVRDAIDQALEDAANGLELAEAVNKAYLQPTAPTNPDPDGRALVVNDPWFDSDDTNRPYRWDGSAWVDATTSWLDTNPTSTYPNVVISPAGLVAYNGAGVAVTSIDSSNGFLTTTGSIFSAADISGSTVTGGVVQTDASVAPNRTGVKMNSAGMAFYDPTSHTATFVLDTATGSIVMAGGLWSGGTVIGATVVAGASASSGERIIVRLDGSGGVIEFFSGLSGETAGNLNPVVRSGTLPGLELNTGLRTGSGITERAQIIMASGSSGTSSIDIAAGEISIGNGFTLTDDVAISGAVVLAGVFDAYGNLTVHGNLSVTGSYPSSGSSWVGTATSSLNMAGYGISGVNGLGMAGTAITSVGSMSGSGGVTMGGAGHFDTVFADSAPTTGTAVNAVMGGSGQFLKFTSARRYKYDDEAYEIDLDVVCQLTHKRFRRYDDPDYDEDNPGAGRWYYGVIANEAEALDLAPWCTYDDDGELQSFDYVGFATAVALAAARQIATLTARIETLEAA